MAEFLKDGSVPSKHPLNATKPVLPQVTFLRALASLSVCVFHLYCGNVHLFPNNVYPKKILLYGYLGVPVFFVISGFIICYSLPACYRLSQFKTFFIKRIIRIEPPYLASVALVLLLNYSGSFVTHVPVDFSWENLFFHLAYLNNFNAGTYYNVVYWTLGIEFQFYLLIGLLFPLLNKSQTIFILLMLAFLAATFIPLKGNVHVITSLLPIFGLGILVFFFQYKRSIRLWCFSGLSALFLIQIYISGHDTFWACIFSITILFLWRIHHWLISFFAEISFSLYLTHTTIGGKVINLGLRFVSTAGERYLLFLTAFIVTAGFAWLFYCLIERPCMKYVKRISYQLYHLN